MRSSLIYLLFSLLFCLNASAVGVHWEGQGDVYTHVNFAIYKVGDSVQMIPLKKMTLSSSPDSSYYVGKHSRYHIKAIYQTLEVDAYAQDSVPSFATIDSIDFGNVDAHADITCTTSIEHHRGAVSFSTGKFLSCMLDGRQVYPR